MKLLQLALAFLIACVLAGCSGIGTDDYGPKGLGFSSENPRTALPGQSFRLLIFANTVASADISGVAHLRIAATGATPVNPNVDIGMSPYFDTKTYSTIELTVPANAVVGSQIQVTIERDVPLNPDVTHTETFNMTVGNNLITATLNPASVSGIAGASVNSTLTLTSHGTAAGQVSVVSLLGGVTATPSTVTLTQGGSANVAIRFTIPASAFPGQVFQVPVVFTAQDGHGFAVLTVTTQAVTQPDFALSLDRTSLNITPGDSTNSVTVTITPEPGMRGDVSVQVVFPHASLSLTPPTANPFVINVNSDAPVTASFRVRWNAQQGFPQGQAVVTGTRAAYSHSANFNIVAS